MADSSNGATLRSPGNPGGGSRGKSCPQQNRPPLSENDGDEGMETAMGAGSTTYFGTQPPKVGGKKGNPVR